MEYRTLGGSGCVVSTPAPGTMTFGAETARLDAASDPNAADHPYGGPGLEQRDRKLEGGR